MFVYTVDDIILFIALSVFIISFIVVLIIDLVQYIVKKFKRKKWGVIMFKRLFCNHELIRFAFVIRGGKMYKLSECVHCGKRRIEVIVKW